MQKILGIVLLSLTCSSLAHAQSIDYKAMQDDGFGNEAALLQSMTPQQRADILKQAAITQNDFKKMSPQQLQALHDQLRSNSDTIKIDQIDPNKIDTSKIKTTAATQKDLSTYQQQYSQGKIHNDAVKSPDGSE